MNTSNNKANKYNIMNKQEFLAASLPYRLKCMYIGTDGVRKSNLNFDSDDYSYPTQLIGIIEYCHYFKDLGNDMELIEEHKFKPIVRPLDSLTKECVQSDYNEGEPFIPIVELAKYVIDVEKYYSLFYTTEGTFISLFTEKYIFGYNYRTNIFSFYRRNENGQLPDHTLLIFEQMSLYQLLLKWHYWPSMPEGEEVVYVTDEFNPYK